jgi:hypothetical protein
MNTSKDNLEPFRTGLQKLGFQNDDALYFEGQKLGLPDPEILFHIEKAEIFGAKAVYVRKQLNGSYKPQVYLFDYTDRGFSEQIENEIADIQKKIWSSGEVPLACIFFKTEIKIIDCTKHITNDLKPEYLVDSLKLADKAHKLYNEQFALKIKTGIFWEQEELKGKFDFKNSAYDTLLRNIRIVVENLTSELKDTSNSLINKIIVQSILIKYLEETSDYNGKRLLSNKFFKKYNNASSFSEVLSNGAFVDLLNDLNGHFNGNVFKWSQEEQEKLKDLKNLKVLGQLLESNSDIKSGQGMLWRYFEFKFVPVELISRLYEEFLVEDKEDDGKYYTPAHLAKLLVDECLPLNKFKQINPESYSTLDPACGSGIFLVTAFKRLVQIWRLRHDLKKLPSVKDLQRILKNLYGVDKEEQAIMLTSFSLSLALCNELNPIERIEKLRFDDLRENNLFYSDFFECKKIRNEKFDLVIGNPPYVRGGTKNFNENYTSIAGEKVEVPNNQIALKFLGDSYSNLKQGGLQCLLVKSSGILYNTTSRNFSEKLFSKTNVVQILDFTALARNKTLWDNKKVQLTKSGERKETPLEVDTAAIFIREGKPDFTSNILHLTFRRTKATKERILFEVDDYDLHFVNRQNAIDNPFIWKCNLLGGGRIKTVIEKLSSFGKFVDLFIDEVTPNEGAGGPKSLPNQAFLGNKIDDDFLTDDYLMSFENSKAKDIYDHPNFLVKENIDLPFALNGNPIKFNNEIVGFHSKDLKFLKSITNYFIENHDILKFYNICTSGKMLVYKNTACKKEDILNLPVNLDIDLKSELSEVDFNIINDVNSVMQYFLRNGENSNAVKPIKNEAELKSTLLKYGEEFSKSLNFVYGRKNRKIRLSDVVEFDNSSLIAVVFKFDEDNSPTKFHINEDLGNIDRLINNVVSSNLYVNRIIKLYSQKDTIVFVKPNQLRYWIALTAYRDADKCFTDLSNAGY